MKDASFVRQVSVEHLPFRPAAGMASPHIQTILPTLFCKGGVEPPSSLFYVSLEDGDAICCKISTPLTWKPQQKTILLLHGLGGSDSSAYMIRLTRKFYQAGYRSIRVNLRGIGEGAQWAQRPYHGGTSYDILQVIKNLKGQSPESPLILIGFSLGGNIALKLLGELGEQASSLIDKTLSICPPIDLAHTTQLLFQRSNRLYHQYYVNGLKKLGKRWIGKQSVRSIIDFDNVVTAPQWGFRDASDYYQQSSSKFFLPDIRHTCHLIFAADDPFVDYRAAVQTSLYPSVKVWLSQYGGHMGFWGWAGKEHGYHWLDPILMKLIQGEKLVATERDFS